MDSIDIDISGQKGVMPMRVEEEQHSRTVRKGVCDWDDEPEFQNVMTLSILPPAESAWGTSMKRV